MHALRVLFSRVSCEGLGEVDAMNALVKRHLDLIRKELPQMGVEELGFGTYHPERPYGDEPIECAWVMVVRALPPVPEESNQPAQEALTTRLDGLVQGAFAVARGRDVLPDLGLDDLRKALNKG
jgi:hypothetical protein